MNSGFPASVAIPADVMARQVGDETVILHLGSGNYYGLDPVGARAWQLLGEGRTPAEVCEQLLGEYDVARVQLEADLQTLLQDLLANGLLTAGA
ncbi:MAG: PqqD family protein [Pseudomonadota bacterium]